jgi:hypothetical protein
MRTTLLATALIASAGLSAQQTVLKPYQESPAATVSQDLGSCNVKIDYHRPVVKGRKVWGGLVPFGEVWRTGANDATVITFSDPVSVNGQPLAAGSYAFFAIPGAETWTLIFNKQAKQWGAYGYKQAEDALRVQAKPRTAPFQEALAYSIGVAAPDKLRVELGWENLAVGFDVAMDVRGIYWTYLEKTLAGARPEESTPFAQGANYCLNNNTHLDKGLAWVDQSIKAKETYRNLEIKARLLDKTGRTKEALPLLEKAMELAKAAKASAESQEALAKTKAEWSQKK